MPGSTSRLRTETWTALGVAALFAAWHVLSLRYNPVLVPAPRDTFSALARLAGSGELARNVGVSLGRQVTGLVAGVSLGTLTGIAAGLCEPIEHLMKPVTSTLMASPAIVFAVMAMVWFGMGTSMTVFLVALLTFPVMHVNSLEGLRSIDRRLIEMAEVFRVPAGVRWRKIYIPGFMNAFLAGFSLAAASSIRLTVMGELLGSREGVGQAIAISRSYLETDELFAWVMVIVAMVFAQEALVSRLLGARARAWRGLGGT